MEKLERYSKLAYSIALLLIMSGVAMLAFFEKNQELSLALVNAGSIIIFVTFVRGRRRSRGGTLKDERTVKLGSYGLSYSWIATLVLVTLLFWVDLFGLVRFNVSQILGILLFVMVLTAKGFQWYLFRKGDVE
ncbi:hypothetical protein V7O62_10100 [Methanolobus sp. ZRKC2]|uniref:hypothetical protein n=1 Tax=Methanolobus sp. ZRKC2 TaxID=3125783 RepID=UPI003247A8E6